MNKDFMTYLQNIIDLEKTAYVQKHTIQKLTERIDRLGKFKRIERYEVQQSADWGFYLIASGTIAVPIGAIWFGLKGLFSDFLSGAISGIFTGALLGLAVAGVIAAIRYFIDRAKDEAKQQSYDERYDQEKKKDQKRVDEENMIKKRLMALRYEMEEQARHTQDTLDQYYGLNLIYPKYRNLNAVCSFYEYFDSERCTELKGHEGAYGIYELEVRLNVIVVKLDEILTNLEAIKNNQYMLYSALNEGNKKMDRLLSEAEQQTKLAGYIAEQTEIAAYNSAEAANEVRQLKWLEMYKSWKE